MNLVKDNLVAVTDQMGKAIAAFRPEETDWNAAGAVMWRWRPDETNGFAGLTAYWGFPTDAKIRPCPKWGGYWMVVTDSAGLAAVIPFPAGDRRRWGLCVGGNPHSAELLPNGNIAVAASTGGWVRVYASSQGPDCDIYAEYPMVGAHGVQWDPERQVLWALGTDHLAALRIEGTDERPVLREQFKQPLPTRGGHDLQPVYGDPDRLWVSTSTNVYQYSKTQNAFTDQYPDSTAINRPFVKSVGNLPASAVVSTVPDKRLRPETGAPHNDWCTDTVDLFCGGASSSRVLNGSAIYKARILCAEYL